MRNLGTTAAFDVDLKIDPPPQRAAGDGRPTSLWIPHRIPVLAPGQEWRTLWDFSPRRATSDLPDRHEATVTFYDSQGTAFSARYVLDWSAYTNRMFVTTYGLHHAAKALREINRTIGRWQESARGGLSVFVRDGDAKDERLRAEWEDDDAGRESEEED